MTVTATGWSFTPSTLENSIFSMLPSFSSDTHSSVLSEAAGVGIEAWRSQFPPAWVRVVLDATRKLEFSGESTGVNVRFAPRSLLDDHEWAVLASSELEKCISHSFLMIFA